MQLLNALITQSEFNIPPLNAAIMAAFFAC